MYRTNAKLNTVNTVQWVSKFYSGTRASIDHITASTLNMSSNKTPPLLSATKDYSSWKKSIKIWSEFTSLEPKKQGAAVFLTLDGTACDAALELDE